MLYECGHHSDSEVLKVSQAKGAAFDEFDFIVDTLDDATGRAVMKIIGNSIRPVV